MKFKKNEIRDNVTKDVVEKETQDKTTQTTQSGFKFNKNTSTSVDNTTEQKVEASKTVATTKAKKVEGSDWDLTSKILPKFVNKSSKAEVKFGTAIEFSKAPFNLCKRNEQGYRDSLDGKLLMNIWSFDKQTNKQINLIPTYIDISEWLNLCHMVLSDRLFKLTDEAKAKQQSGGYTYCSYIYQNNGGSSKPIFKVNGQKFGGKNGNPIATVFKITPSKSNNSWVFSSEIYDGITGPTGLIERKKAGTCHAKVQVMLTYEDLIRIAKMSEMAIQAHFIKMQ